MGRAFYQRLEEKAREYDHLAERPDTRPKQGRAQWVGLQAQEAWIHHDLPKHCGFHERAIHSNAIAADQMTGVSNLGDPRRTDALATVGGEVVQFELKKSDYGGSRASSQLAAQVFDLGLGTYGATTLNVIYGEDGRVDVYTREDAGRAVENRRKEFEVPRPTETIKFSPVSRKHEFR